MRAGIGFALLACYVGLGSAIAQSLSMPKFAAGALPPGPGRDLVATACTQCHSLAPILDMRDGPNGWRRHVRDMILKGAQLNEREMDTVVGYLSANLGPGQLLPPPKPVTLPEGKGKDLVEARCTLCHDLERVTATRRDHAGWVATVSDMYRQLGASAPEEQAIIESYLSGHYGTAHQSERPAALRGGCHGECGDMASTGDEQVKRLGEKDRTRLREVERENAKLKELLTARDLEIERMKMSKDTAARK